MRPRWVKWEMKTKHFCPCEFLSQNKDTHPPFSLRFNTKHQLGLNLQTTLLSSHPPPVTCHAKATTLILVTIIEYQGHAHTLGCTSWFLCTNAGVEVPRRWCTVTHPHIPYSTFSHKSFSCCWMSVLLSPCRTCKTGHWWWPLASCTWEFLLSSTLVCRISRHGL